MDESRSNANTPRETADTAPETGPDTASPELDELRAQLAEKQDRLLRALAEIDNIRRRALRDRDDYVRYANESLMRDLIPVLDNLDRALAAARTDSGASALREGVELIQREMLKVLERAGLTRYSALDAPFDPTRHEAVARVVSPHAAPNTVVEETLPGYMLNNRVLRAALVSVAMAPDEDAT
jgi:molecular chaperone GrpE